MEYHTEMKNSHQQPHGTIWMTHKHTESRQPDTKKPDCVMKHAECKNSPANLLQGKSGQRDPCRAVMEVGRREGRGAGHPALIWVLGIH